MNPSFPQLYGKKINNKIKLLHRSLAKRCKGFSLRELDP